MLWTEICELPRKKKKKNCRSRTPQQNSKPKTEKIVRRAAGWCGRSKQPSPPSPPSEMQSMNGGSEESWRPHFFKVLLPNFSTQLQLPRAFVKQHIFTEDEKSGNVALLSPDWKTWNVSLHKNQQDTYFSGDEWRACTEALNLNVGYFLFFTYMGNMQFSFKVFDLSTCEKVYPRPPPPTPQTRPQRQLTPVSTKFDDAAAAAKRAGKFTTVKRIKQCKDGHLFEIVGQHGNGGSITSVCKVCKCTRLEIYVSSTNLSRSYYLRLPVAFLEFSGLSEKHKRLTLVDLKRRSWPIGFTHSIDRKAKSGCATRLSKGWKEFCLDNQLEMGDCCVFELEAGVKDTMHVQVLKS